MISRLSLIFLFVFICTTAFSQAPQSFKYQAVARDPSGALLSNKAITVRASIRDTAINGIIVYQENHSVTTNQFGLININIGAGTVTAGSFTTIKWGNGDKFIEIEIDFGSGFITMGISQLLSVPYALYAANGPVGPQGIQGNAGLQGPQGLQGIQGISGLNGTNGLSVDWLGTFGSPPTPCLNCAYHDSILKMSFIWNGSAWKIITEDGNAGPPGFSNIQTYAIHGSTSINTNSVTPTVIPGLSLTITLSSQATLNIFSDGTIGQTKPSQILDTYFQIFQNGLPVANLNQEISTEITSTAHTNLLSW
jgi:hypothetical protein